MKLIELRIDEDASQPLELHDVVKFFPNTYARVIKVKAHSGQLTFAGKALTHDGSDGPAITEAEQQVDHILEENEGVEIHLDMDTSELDNPHLGDHSFSFNAKVDDKKLVFLGYHPPTNRLFLGYDVWLSENEFNDEWDREFEKAAGEPFDQDDPDHEAVFQKAWKQFQEMTFIGMLFSVNDDFVGEQEYELPGGFYKSIAKMEGVRRLELIHIFG